MIRAIQTEYKNYRFRSRLETRWAVFLTEMGASWLYEPEGFDMDGERYLPDFWVKHLHYVQPHPTGLPPEQGFWIEIKPTSPTEHELELCRLLARLTKHCVYLLAGNIGVQEYVCHKFHFQGGHIIEGKGLSRHSDDLWPERTIFDHYLTVMACPRTPEDLFAFDRLPIAYRAARSARFEHGESGAPGRRRSR
jgi:hypothetical protein